MIVQTFRFDDGARKLFDGEGESWRRAGSIYMRSGPAMCQHAGLYGRSPSKLGRNTLKIHGSELCRSLPMPKTLDALYILLLHLNAMLENIRVDYAVSEWSVVTIR